MARECGCRGGNENCTFCHGSGYVDRPVQKRVSDERKSWCGAGQVEANSRSYWIDESEDHDVSRFAVQLSWAKSVEEIDILWAEEQAKAEVQDRAETQDSAYLPEWRRNLAEWKAKAKLEANAREVTLAKTRVSAKLESEAQARAWAEAQAKAEEQVNTELRIQAEARAKAEVRVNAELRIQAEARAKTKAVAEQAWRSKELAEQATRAKIFAEARARALVWRLILIAVLTGFVLIGILNKVLKG